MISLLDIQKAARVALPAFCIAVSALPASAQSQVSGSVTDPSGAMVTGARLELKGPVLRTTESDQDGLFTLLGVPEGDYNLSVSKAGFQTVLLSIAIRSNAALRKLRISLELGGVSTTIGVQGREDDLLGVVSSATEGTVGASELRTRPILRSGEILEALPGMIITQHAGGGKANQYFLRGFNLDHGTDFAIFIDGMPLNLPSHAHGEGYSDMNTVIPEFVQRVNYEKGPYYADVGNYGSAGAAHLEFRKTLPENFLQVESGVYGYGRAVWGFSHKLRTGGLLFGGEVYHDDGPWLRPDNYMKYNGLLTYSRGSDAGGLSVTARGYHGKWNSSDQIAENAVPLVGFFGSIDPTDGGRSERYSVQGEWHRRSESSSTQITPYLFYYDLNLYSNFTYFLTDPVQGDQFNQNDRRWVVGLEAQHTVFSTRASHRVQNTLGLQVRNDWIGNGLYQASHRMRVDKTDAATGNTLPAITQRDNSTDALLGVYAENRVQWTSKFRSVIGLRGDLTHLDVTSLVTSANSGIVTKAIPSPKASLILGPWWKTEFYFEGGSSFHSNDARGTAQTVTPISGENPYPNVAAEKIPPLIPTKGAEFGVRTSAVPHLNSTLSFWYFHSKSELQQSGDTGGTTASSQPSDRYGFELANYWTPNGHFSIDFDLANSRALFAVVDPDDAAPNSNGGRRVPEAVGLVVATGAVVRDLHRMSGSLRLRFFGPRDLTSDGLYRSRLTVLLNGELGYRLHERWSVCAELLNVLNRRDHDIDYAYQSQITPTAASAFTNVFHPVEPIQVRFWLRKTF